MTDCGQIPKLPFTLADAKDRSNVTGDCIFFICVMVAVL